MKISKKLLTNIRTIPALSKSKKMLGNNFSFKNTTPQVEREIY